MVAGLAGAAIARLVTMENGPYEIFVRFQVWLKSKKPTGIGAQVAQAVSCVFCLSVWMSALFFAVLSLAPGLSIAVYVIAAFGVAWTALGIQGRF